MSDVSATVEAVARATCVSPGDVPVLISMYPDDIDDLWVEEGLLSRVGMDEVHETFNPMCQRTVPQLYPSQ
jgi:hypothetical protein